MANQACISIGINQYQFFQPLGYGTADAVAMEQFFLEAAGWSPSQCLLLTDTSSKTGDRSTYPDRANINRWLKQWCWDTLKAGDLLWFFFSGYGASIGGEDYLVPIDGNPEDIPNTCISLRQVYQQLHDIGVNAFVFLDANRAQSTSLGGGIGTVAAKLAQDYQIPTILSCQSHEFSHEASGLGHGLFTIALLEALNYHPDLNLETIESYLTSRLAELSEHHWKPLQTPIAIVPTGVSIYRPVFSATTQSSISTPATEPAYSPPIKPQLDLGDGYAAYTPPIPLNISPEITISTGAIVKRPEPERTTKNLSSWKKVGLLLALIVSAGGGIYAFQNKLLTGNNPPVVIPEVTTPNIPSTGKTGSLSQARLLVKPGDATSRYVAILAARKIPADTPANTEVARAIEQWSKEIYQIAQGYANRQLWQLAIDTAKMVPPDATNYIPVQAAMAEWKTKIGSKG